MTTGATAPQIAAETALQIAAETALQIAAETAETPNYEKRID